MDIGNKWKPNEIRHAKNILRGFNKMVCGNDMQGIEARALTRAIDWLEQLIFVMENPPIEVDKIEEKKQPADIKGNINDTSSKTEAEAKGGEGPNKTKKGAWTQTTNIKKGTKMGFSV